MATVSLCRPLSRATAKLDEWLLIIQSSSLPHLFQRKLASYQRCRCFTSSGCQHKPDTPQKNVGSVVGSSSDTTRNDSGKEDCKSSQKLDLTMTGNALLKITLADSEMATGQDSNSPFIFYQKIDFSSLERQLESSKLTPLILKWMPRSLKRKFYSSMLKEIKQKAYLGEDFNDEEFRYFGGLAAMKVSDIILQNDFSGLQDLVVQNIVLTGKENQTLEGIHEVSPCSSEDMVWTGISKVMIQEQSPHHGIVHITLHTLCKLNAQLKEMAMASPKILFGSKIPAKVFHVILRRMACTYVGR